MMIKTLSGKVAIVTGGSRGIGAAIALRLAESGADVAITYASRADSAEAVAQQIRAAGQRALAIKANSADAAAVRSAVDQAAAAFGRLDILVNNAGIFTGGTVEQVTLEDFDRIIAANLRGAFVASQAAAAHMGEGGRIVSIGSNLVGRVGRAGIGLYVMSKAALTGLSQAMARDLGPRGITVNIVHPGPTDTDMNPATTERADQARAAMAIPKYGEPGQIAGLVAWLASPEAQYATGGTYTIDGGTNA
ncbi:3-oxoacyl-ACP reductase family protein [Labrys neptuniae]|uniref:3-oxoacyl-ACP reductase family protein n=1 Tax=Labrys neptuniae TaxID=376174 RepID=UPI00289147AA|nr:3-oxoacyl-ACP reductase family protein [Labrys neptuniae]MDT3376124.1 3-oxoacyl-ACP reductase family protein [Labrys neptuniae]